MKSAVAQLNNADIAKQLLALAQVLSTQGENPYKIRAYRRAAETVQGLSESVDELVRADADLTQFSGIGKAIAGAIREIVLSGKLQHLETLRSELSPEVAALNAYPRLDPKRVQRIYKKLNISSVDELRLKLESGAIEEKLGSRLAQHVRQALTESSDILFYEAETLVPTIQAFLQKLPGVGPVEATGDFRRRVEIVRDLSFLIEAENFSGVLEGFQKYGGRADLISSANDSASFRLSSGVLVALHRAVSGKWGLALLIATGSDLHLEKLEGREQRLAGLAGSREKILSEEAAYEKLGLSYIEPELREGNEEVEQAAAGTLPKLIELDAIKGDLHAHSTSSDGAHSIEAMAEAARERGYTYLGISDHSQSLRIAGGVSEEDLRKQIRAIDKLNSRLRGFRVLKSAEVDILVDGSLDYPDELLAELDYTVCSIHSRFGLGKEKQTERILRAMDNRYFNILGHATGRLLMRRPGYELDMERIVAHAKERGCFFEINASPDRLDLSTAHVRLARAAGIKIAICTDAHSTAELDFIHYGIDQARRAGLEKNAVLNTQSWEKLAKDLKR